MVNKWVYITIMGVSTLIGMWFYQSGQVETPSKVSEPFFEDISTSEALTLIDANKDNSNFIILDVRTPEEFSTGYIEGAVNINFYEETFSSELDELDKDKTYLVYCGSGKRSKNATIVMGELGFQEAYNMEGGIGEWKAQGFELVEE